MLLEQASPSLPAIAAATTSTAAGSPPADHPRTILPSAQPPRRILAFYLVSTPAQYEVADWTEQLFATDAFTLGIYSPDREYRILYAADDEQERHAGQAILDALIAIAGNALVEVVDLRTLRTD